MIEVKKTERGWSGHYVCAIECFFRRNTLLECKDDKIVVSTVGNRWNDEMLKTLGQGRYYETKVFHAVFEFEEYWDADVSKEINVTSKSAMLELGSDNEANEMHEAVVKEIESKMKQGEFDVES